MHQSVINILYIGIVGDGEWLLHDDATGIDVVVEEESGDACLRLTIDDSPVDRGSTAVLRKKGCMHIEGAEARHIPYHLWQHSESYHHLQIGLITAQLLYKFRILHLHRLQYWQALRQGILLDLRRLKSVLMATHRFVGLGYYSHHIISAFYKALEGFHRKLRGSHKYDS